MIKHISNFLLAFLLVIIGGPIVIKSINGKPNPNYYTITLLFWVYYIGKIAIFITNFKFF